MAGFEETLVAAREGEAWALGRLFRSLYPRFVCYVGAVVPTGTGLRVLTAVTAGGCGLMFTVVHIIETTERRVIRAGYPPGTGEATRHQRSVAAQREANERRRKRNAARGNRR